MSKIRSLLDKFIIQNQITFEGDTGVSNLSEVAEALGYNGHQFALGSPLEEFLADNPGACKAIIDWIGTRKEETWIESLENAVVTEDEEDDNGDDDDDDEEEDEDD